MNFNSDGSYTYVANSNIYGLEAGETVTDTFNYTITDGKNSDKATITITIIGEVSNNAPVARDVSKAVNENAISSAGDVVNLLTMQMEIHYIFQLSPI